MQKPIAALGIFLLMGVVNAEERYLQAWRKGLVFLQSIQQEDGSFSKKRGRVGMTAMALEALAKAPAEAHNDATRQAAARAAEYLLANQRQGGMMDGAIGDEGAPLNYCTSLSIMALCAYDKIKYQPVIAKAAAYLRNQQCNAANGYDNARNAIAFGGFGYGSSLRPDLSNTWMALYALRNAGAAAEEQPFQDALIFVRRCQNSTEINDLKELAGEDGGAMYLPGNSFGGEDKSPDGRKIFVSTGSMTAAMLMAYLQCGRKQDDKEVSLAYRWLEKNWSTEKNHNNPQNGTRGLYYYYRVLAYALAAHGKPQINGRAWANEICEALAKRQQANGSWVNENDGFDEGEPALVTAYALTALAACQPFLQ